MVARRCPEPGRRAAAPGRRPPRRRIRRAPRGARARSVDGDARLLLLLHHHRVVLLHHLIVLHRRLLTLLPLALLHALRLHLAVVLPPRSVLLHLVLLRLVFLHPVRLHRVALGERLPNDARDPEGQPGRYDHPRAREPARERSHARLLGWVEPSLRSVSLSTGWRSRSSKRCEIFVPAARRERSDDLVGPGGGLAEPSHRVRREPPVDLLEAQVDLSVRNGEEALSLAISLHEEGAESLDLEHPEGLGDSELREPVDVDDALDAPTVRGAHPVSHGGEIDGTVRHEPLAIRELGEPRLAHDDPRARALEPPAHRFAEAEARRRRDGLDGVGAVRPDGRCGRAVEIDIAERPNADGKVHTLLDDLAIHTLPRRVENARDEHDVAELEARQVGRADGRSELDLVHPHVIEPLDHCSGGREPGAIGGWPETRRDPAPSRHPPLIPPRGREPGAIGGWPETRRDPAPSRHPPLIPHLHGGSSR